MQRTYQSPTSDRPPPAQRADGSILVQANNSSTGSNTSPGATDYSAGSTWVSGTISDQDGTVVGGARPPRSKKQRPCDRCRHRKSRCAISRPGEACTECSQTNNECTFILPPPARAKKELLPDVLDRPPAPSTSSHDPALPRSTSLSPEHRPSKRLRQASPSRQDFLRPSGTGSETFSLDQDLPADVEPSTVTATLTDDLLTSTSNTVGPPSKMVSSASQTTFITFGRRPSYRMSSHEEEVKLLRQIRSFLAFATSNRNEGDFLDRYFQYNHPFFPVTSASSSQTFDTLPTGLQALILAEALANFPGFRAAGREAQRIAKESRIAEKMLDAQPKLSSIAASLVELNMGMDPRGDFLLLSKTIAHAQLLGLHIDCQGWKALPEWEKSLRTRLWWMLRTQDAWSSFLNSRPSHLQAGNTTVGLPRFPSSSDTIDDSYLGGIAFGCACRLGIVVARLQVEVSTLDRYGNSSRAESCDSIETDLNTMKEGLKDYYEMASSRPPGMDSVLFLLLALRCMVRRVGIEIRIGIGASFAPDHPTLSVFAELVEFVESLSGPSFDANQVYPSHASHVFSSVLSSLVRLSLAYAASNPTTSSTLPVSSALSSSPINLLSRLVRSMVHLRTVHQWDLVDSALDRAASVTARLEEAGAADYQPVISALQGTDPVAHNSTVDTGFLDTLAALAAQPPRSLTSVDTAPLNVEDLGDISQWLSVLDEGPSWEDGIDWRLFSSG